MKTLMNAILVGTLLAVAGVTSAAGAADPILGTWTLNVAKSHFTPGPAPKSQTRTYAATADGTNLKVSGVTADGSAISQEAIFKYDGKTYAMSGSPDYDGLALKRVNGSTVKSKMMKGDKQVGTTVRIISAHGKVMTLTTKITDAAGKPSEFVGVFEKQ
jgi:hypothetical protein